MTFKYRRWIAEEREADEGKDYGSTKLSERCNQGSLCPITKFTCWKLKIVHTRLLRPAIDQDRSFWDFYWGTKQLMKVTFLGGKDE